MPPHKKGILARLNNFKSTAKRVLELLSPQKKSKRQRIEEQDPDNVISDQASEATQLDDDFSLAENMSYTGVFDSFSCSEPPTRPPSSEFLEFTLPPVLLDDNSSEECTPSILGTQHHTPPLSLGALGSSCPIRSDDSLNEPPNDHDDEIRDGKLREAPPLVVAAEALKDIQECLRGKSKGKGGGYRAPKIDPFVRSRMEGMRTLLALYTSPASQTYEKWVLSSSQAAITLGRGRYCARVLRRLARAYMLDRRVLPINPYGEWTESLLANEDLSNDINLYLQELGNKITAEKLVDFLSTPEIQEKHGISGRIHITTARRYLRMLDFRFTHAAKGQYSDGHEREDVVHYRDTLGCVRTHNMAF